MGGAITYKTRKRKGKKVVSEYTIKRDVTNIFTHEVIGRCKSNVRVLENGVLIVRTIFMMDFEDKVDDFYTYIGKRFGKHIHYHIETHRASVIAQYHTFLNDAFKEGLFDKSTLI